MKYQWNMVLMVRNVSHKTRHIQTCNSFQTKCKLKSNISQCWESLQVQLHQSEEMIKLTSKIPKRCSRLCATILVKKLFSHFNVILHSEIPRHHIQMHKDESKHLSFKL